MKVCHASLNQKHEPVVLALGNFDGVHLGHQRLLNFGKERAEEKKVELAVILFDPHPLKIINPQKKLQLITDRTERLKLFEGMGVDKVFILPFTEELANTPPRNFVEEVLLQLGAVHIVVGFNYSFGAKRKGSPEDLEKFGKEYGFGVNVLQAQKMNGKIISSSEIRRYILNGEIIAAGRMLGRKPSLKGRVIHGDKRGRLLGFPTANIKTDPEVIIPKKGVYAVTSVINKVRYCGMMNIGTRPTFLEQADHSIEVHLFDFDGDLYGRELIIELNERIRPEKKFACTEDIITQLKHDKEKALSLQEENQDIL